jgi:hypothetical protein
MSVATDTVVYKQIFDDCDIPVEVEWQVEYVVESTAGDQEIRITDHHLVEVRAELMSGRFFRVATQDVDTTEAMVAADLWSCVDEADVLEACWRHFDNS